MDEDGKGYVGGFLWKVRSLDYVEFWLGVRFVSQTAQRGKKNNLFLWLLYT